MRVVSTNQLRFSRWWFQIFFIFTPNLGEMIQFDYHIFQMGWNHQPVRFFHPSESHWFSAVHKGLAITRSMYNDRLGAHLVGWVFLGEGNSKQKNRERTYTPQSGIPKIYNKTRWWFQTCFCVFIPKNWGKWIQIDLRIFFQMDGSTTN